VSLPPSNIAWPPPQLARILPTMNIWSAWYGGDIDQLAAVYGGRQGSDPSGSGFFASDTGGFKATVSRTLSRWFHGEPTRGPDRRIKLHVPIAADLCQSSADLIFSDPPSLTVGDKPPTSKGKPNGKQSPTQDRLDFFTEGGLYTRFAEAVELGAALGGVYLRVSWSEPLCPEPFLTILDADSAVPEFSYDTMTAVTFWRVLKKDGQAIWRHLERHETDLNGIGWILHGLYCGDEKSLGRQLPLTEMPETAGFSDDGHPLGEYSTETPGLAVVYIPNQRPNRLWRSDPLGRHLGRSDLSGVEQLMDALDETYTSWQRDVRLGKARIMMSRALLENNGSGLGATMNIDQEAYAPVNALIGSATGLDQLISQVQFNIRVQEHMDTAENLLEQIVRSAGYSGHAFSITPQVKGTKTATEIESMDRRSLLTRDRKIRLVSPAISYICTKLLLVDQAIFNTPNLTIEDVQVNFPDGVQESQLTLAQTALALSTAGAASKEVLVGIVHPDWDDDDIAAEAAAILAEEGAMVPPPTAQPFGATDQPPVPAQK
jgi:A118 family predicted phage portal protein